MAEFVQVVHRGHGGLVRLSPSVSDISCSMYGRAGAYEADALVWRGRRRATSVPLAGMAEAICLAYAVAAADFASSGKAGQRPP